MSQAPIELGPINATPPAVSPPGHETHFRVGPFDEGANVSSDDTRTLHRNAEFSLPPVDSGKEAWLFLAACFVVDALIWGYAFSFGVFQDYYSQHAPFATSGNIAVIGTTAVGVLYLASPVVLGLCRLYPHHTRFATPVGLLVTSLALALASLASSTDALIVLQGALYAVGGAMAYCPTILYIDEWFVARKGMAYGMVWSGEGLASAVIPLILQRLLARFGHETTLRASGVAIFLICAPLSFFIKPRLPPSQTTAMRPWGLKFLFSSLFVPYQLGNLVQGTGHFIPGIYLPTYARTVFGASGFLSALTVLLINVATTVGCVIMGTLTDRLPATTCIVISSAGATIGVFIIWGLSSSLAVLYAFCVVYGLFAGSFTSTWPGIMRLLGRSRVTDDASPAAMDPAMIFGWLCAGRGVGSLISGPLSDALTKSMAWKGHASAGYGSGYGTLIAYTGITALLGCSSFVWKKLITPRSSLQQ
ncbi:putative major facilitator superfamily transporter protein [Rosellinia necatrix]|uniref:Putative major facilitator superfamily transporter protein n=1 Tax=Rosellinia necatrix TaxID=77044 RepID=A0A1W2TJS7_ROSNE|nr:putative major facilitator superfamily transporter protein [Rosellinia necatrix]